MRHLFPFFALTLHALSVTAEPALLSHAGYLLGPGDQPVDGPVSLRFGIFAVASGGSATWTSDPCSVVVKAGYYSVDLGAACNNAVAPLEVADVAGERWLEVRVGGTTLQPRYTLTEAPRAVHATSLSGGSVDATSVSVAGQLVIDASGRLAGPARYSAGAGVSIDNATQTLSLDPSCGVGEVLVRSGAGWACQPAGPAAASVVGLQATTPGTAQAGHVNVSGTLKAGSFAGSGAGLTNLPGGQLAANSVPATALTSGSGNADRVLTAMASGAPVWTNPASLPSLLGLGGGWTTSGSDAVKSSGNAIVTAGDVRLMGSGRRIWLTDPSNGNCYGLQMSGGTLITPRIDCASGVSQGVCAPGLAQCAGNAVQTCAAGGTWGTAAVCVNKSCVAGACQGTCAAGATACSGNGVVTCSLQGAWSSAVACVNQACVSGACQGVCTPGATQCSGSGVQTCQADGSWGAASACALGCLNGQCQTPCYPNPCVHGTCSTDGSSFTCGCDAGWVGSTCAGNCSVCNVPGQTCSSTGGTGVKCSPDAIRTFTCAYPNTCFAPGGSYIGANGYTPEGCKNWLLARRMAGDPYTVAIRYDTGGGNGPNSLGFCNIYQSCSSGCSGSGTPWTYQYTVVP